MTRDGANLKGIAEMLGISRQRVFKLPQQDGFPAPLAVLSMARFGKAGTSGIGRPCPARLTVQPEAGP